MAGSVKAVWKSGGALLRREFLVCVNAQRLGCTELEARNKTAIKRHHPITWPRTRNTEKIAEENFQKKSPPHKGGGEVVQ